MLILAAAADYLGRRGPTAGGATCGCYRTHWHPARSEPTPLSEPALTLDELQVAMRARRTYYRG